jgi:hypothetical protein
MCIKLVIEISLYYDARSKKHQKNKLFQSCPQTNEMFLRYSAVSLEFAVVTH